MKKSVHFNHQLNFFSIQLFFKKNLKTKSDRFYFKKKTQKKTI